MDTINLLIERTSGGGWLVTGIEMGEHHIVGIHQTIPGALRNFADFFEQAAISKSHADISATTRESNG